MNQNLTKIIDLVSLGKTNKEIAAELHYSPSTVKRRIKELFKLYNVNNRLSLAQEHLMERLN